jgi:hypothetical protein
MRSGLSIAKRVAGPSSTARAGELFFDNSQEADEGPIGRSSLAAIRLCFVNDSLYKRREVEH